MLFITKLRQQDVIDHLRRTIQGYQERFERDRELERIKASINFHIGTKIFVIPNHPCDLIVGEVVGYEEMCASCQLFLLYRNVFTDEIEMTHNASYWNQDLEDVIRDLPWWKRWNIVHPIRPYSEAQALHLETHGSLCDFDDQKSEIASDQQVRKKASIISATSTVFFTGSPMPQKAILDDAINNRLRRQDGGTTLMVHGLAATEGFGQPYPPWPPTGSLPISSCGLLPISKSSSRTR